MLLSHRETAMIEPVPPHMENLGRALDDAGLPAPCAITAAVQSLA
jgi:hypothetical protein